MNNQELYDKAFIDTFDIESSELNENLIYSWYIYLKNIPHQTFSHDGHFLN